MNASTLDWRGLLATLRAHLPAQRGAGSVGGSLRWLEEAMRARGTGAAALHNIVYRDVGTPADKQALQAILGGLCAEVCLSVPPLHLPPGSPADLELLGCGKKCAFRTFCSTTGWTRRRVRQTANRCWSLTRGVWPTPCRYWGHCWGRCARSGPLTAIR